MGDLPPGFGTRFHTCASCRHFLSGREEGRIFMRCARLGFDTKAAYQFNCWEPKEKVKKRIQLYLARTKDNL